MKPIAFILLCLAGWALPGAEASAQVAWQAEALSPEDLGATKYFLSAKAPKGSVVVFRKEEYLDDRLISRYETISNTPMKKSLESVLLINWAILKGKTRYTLITKMRSQDLDTNFMQSWGVQAKPPLVRFGFRDGTAEGTPSVRTILFTMFVERYENVKKRFPKLPGDLEYGWVYAFDNTPEQLQP